MRINILIILLLQSEMAMSQINQSDEVSELKNMYSNLFVTASKGNNNSQYSIFQLVINNQPNLNDKMNESFSLIIRAGNKGHTKAQFTIGSLYQTGTIVVQDRPVALEWLLEAANKKHVDAQIMVANNYSYQYITTDNTKEQDKYYSLAAFWYEKAILSHSLQAKRLYGELLMNRDEFSHKAESLLTEAALLGDVKAMESLGQMFAYRWDKSNDINYFDKAETWLREAIIKGNNSALSAVILLKENFTKRNKIRK